MQSTAGARLGDRLRAAARVVAADAIEREDSHQMVKEAELDLHQRTVAGVLTLNLMEQALQLRAAGVRQRWVPEPGSESFEPEGSQRGNSSYNAGPDGGGDGAVARIGRRCHGRRA